jgi:succinate dehydrogenase / fumarate reductase flavoprotein subunit
VLFGGLSRGDCVRSLDVEISHDVLVIGAGCAGMRAAIEAHDAGAEVALVSKLHPTRSHSGAARGGINAALGNAGEDSPDEHAFDTIKGSDYLGDQDAIELFCAEAPGDIYQLERWGALFDRDAEGRLAQRPFGGAGTARTVHAADVTGHVLLQLLYEQLLARDIHVYEEYFAWRLVVGDEGCRGVLAWDLVRGGVKALAAKAVILATGGSGRVYHGSTNAHACTGDGMAMALRAGLPLEDMEFVQFHPTTLFPRGLLVTEAVRGEGGLLVNADGERFMSRYAPEAMELASRDVVSRAEQTEIDEGRSLDGALLLDLRHFGPEKMLERFHGTRDLALTYAGLDPLEQPLPVRPGAHYQMGGVATDVDGRTEIENVFAAGEVACISLHGANRLGGNSLMETIVFGRRAGRAAAEQALGESGSAAIGPGACSDGEREIAELLERREGERPRAIRGEIGASMHENFGVFREDGKMRRQLELLEDLRERYQRVLVEDKGEVWNSDLTQALELGFQLDLAVCMVSAGLERRESRGAHSRPSDYPDRDDQNFLKHSLVRWSDDWLDLSWKPVTITKWQPRRRQY